MARKQHPCSNEGCSNYTHGSLCRPCDIIRRSQSKTFDTRKEYARDHALRSKYGMSLEEFHGWWIVFRGKCGICECELKASEPRRGQPLDVAVVDHDHKTGQIRGLLCNACNKGLGLFKDNPEILENARRYLCQEN